MSDKFNARVSGVSVSCLGSQLCRLICAAEPYFSGTWFASDISVNVSSGDLVLFSKSNLEKIGYNKDILSISYKIDQYLSGVFILFENRECLQVNTKVLTEQPFPLNLPGIICEIRAFDTSYFELSSSLEILNAIANYCKTSSDLEFILDPTEE